MRFGRARLLGSVLALFTALHPAMAPMPAVAAAPAEAAGSGRTDRNLVPATRPGRRIPALPPEALTLLPGLLSVTIDGARHSLEILSVSPPGAGPFPLAVISHGSPRDRTRRRTTSLRAYLPMAEDFARRGYIAVIFARRGFGRSSGEHVEGADCTATGYARSARTGAADYVAVIRAMRSDPQVDPTTVIAVGTSAGGFAATGLAADPPPGLIGLISFSGGRGSTKSLAICNAGALTEAYARLGRRASVPALWLYSSTDLFFWPALVAQNLDAYASAGAPVRLEMLGPLWYAADGHALMRPGGRELWRPAIEAFLQDIGAPTWTADPGDAAVPRPPPPAGLRDAGRLSWSDYLGSAGHKAFAMATNGRLAWTANRATIAAATADALKTCERKGDSCRVVSIDGGTPR